MVLFLHGPCSMDQSYKRSIELVNIHLLIVFNFSYYSDHFTSFGGPNLDRASSLGYITCEPKKLRNDI